MRSAFATFAIGLTLLAVGSAGTPATAQEDPLATPATLINEALGMAREWLRETPPRPTISTTYQTLGLISNLTARALEGSQGDPVGASILLTTTARIEKHLKQLTGAEEPVMRVMMSGVETLLELALGFALNPLDIVAFEIARGALPDVPDLSERMREFARRLEAEKIRATQEIDRAKAAAMAEYQIEIARAKLTLAALERRRDALAEQVAALDPRVTRLTGEFTRLDQAVKESQALFDALRAFNEFGRPPQFLPLAGADGVSNENARKAVAATVEQFLREVVAKSIREEQLQAMAGLPIKLQFQGTVISVAADEFKSDPSLGDLVAKLPDYHVKVEVVVKAKVPFASRRLTQVIHLHLFNDSGHGWRALLNPQDFLPPQEVIPRQIREAVDFATRNAKPEGVFQLVNLAYGTGVSLRPVIDPLLADMPTSDLIVKMQMCMAKLGEADAAE